MERHSRWVRREMTCPEERGHSELLLEYRLERRRQILNSISCNNPYLKDLSGGDCGWSCWKRISPTET